MVKITLDVEGMACGMCEAHVNDAIRKAFAVKKVSSSFHKKKEDGDSPQNPLSAKRICAG